MTFNPNDHLITMPGRSGKPPSDYLETKWRLVWLRDRHPDADLRTEHVQLTDEIAIFKATISIPGTTASATGYGSETPRDFKDYIEKAETKAIGRALAALGFGTQFTGDELAEGDRIVDSPVERPKTRQDAPHPVARLNVVSDEHMPAQTPPGPAERQPKASPKAHRPDAPPAVVDPETGELHETEIIARRHDAKHPKRVALYALMGERGLGDDERHLLGWALFGKSSSTTWTDPEVERMHRWVGRHDAERWRLLIDYLQNMDHVAKLNDRAALDAVGAEIKDAGIDDEDLRQVFRNYRSMTRQPAAAGG